MAHRSFSLTLTISDKFLLFVKYVDLPSFPCKDPIGRVAKAETYFICMEGMTWHWFKVPHEANP
ncbi:hypothetical protein CR513_34281, partial [Mucuna pruriens]